MRFAFAVAVAAIAQLFVHLRLPEWVGAGAFLAVLYIALTALGAGWFAARRGALAGALSVVVAVTLSALITFLGPAGAGMFALDFVGAVLRLVIAYWPYILIGALAGATGSALRRRVIGAAR